MAHASTCHTKINSSSKQLDKQINIYVTVREKKMSGIIPNVDDSCFLHMVGLFRLIVYTETNSHCRKQHSTRNVALKFLLFSLEFLRSHFANRKFSPQNTMLLLWIFHLLPFWRVYCESMHEKPEIFNAQMIENRNRNQHMLCESLQNTCKYFNAKLAHSHIVSLHSLTISINFFQYHTWIGRKYFILRAIDSN